MDFVFWCWPPYSFPWFALFHLLFFPPPPFSHSPFFLSSPPTLPLPPSSPPSFLPDRTRSGQIYKPDLRDSLSSFSCLHSTQMYRMGREKGGGEEEGKGGRGGRGRGGKGGRGGGRGGGGDKEEMSQFVFLFF